MYVASNPSYQSKSSAADIAGRRDAAARVAAKANDFTYERRSSVIWGICDFA